MFAGHLVDQGAEGIQGDVFVFVFVGGGVVGREGQ